MSYLNDYVSRLTHAGNPQFASSIKKTADETYSKIKSNFDFIGGRKTGLLFGNIQSGKTGHMFGIICAAADDIFPLFILLTIDNKALENQTLDRVQNDLPDFCICGEYDTAKFIDNNLTKPTIVVLKKNYRTLQQWANTLKSSKIVSANPLFILDDEADAASLNTQINREKQSTINKYLDQINQLSIGSIYLQSTATPQALLLQTADSAWHPDFAIYFSPGQGYLGGNFFFPEDKIPFCINFIDNEKVSLRDAIGHHIIASAQMLKTGDKVCNMMIHPSVRIAKHEEYSKKVKNIIKSFKEKPNDFLDVFSHQYKIISKKVNLLHEEELFKKAKEILCSINIYMLNGKEHLKESDYAEGSNIIIGGNTLGRGVTFPKLQTIYYVRSSKRPNADTMWQHSRMFGYDREANLMAIYISKELYKLFADINSVNNAIVQQIDQASDDLSKIAISLPEGLAPTRSNVLDKKHINIFIGGKNYFPFDPINKSFDKLTKLIDQIDPVESHNRYEQVHLAIFHRILSEIKGSRDFKIEDFQIAIKNIISNHQTQGILIVRRNREITQGTGALLSPNDLALGNSFVDKPVLTMYEVEGKGWSADKLWVPNIKFPDNKVIYRANKKKDSNGND